MPRGGRRPGAGRKSNNQIQEFRNMVDDLINYEIWIKLIHKLALEASEGNMRAMQLLLTYRFGSPQVVPRRDMNFTFLQLPSGVQQLPQTVTKQLQAPINALSSGTINAATEATEPISPAPERDERSDISSASTEPSDAPTP